MAQEVKSEYPCTQQELYSIANTGYDNCSANLADFTNYKGKYTALFITGLKANVTAAKNLPDEEMRNSDFETKRLLLIPMNDKCTNNFQLLKGYINDAYPEEQHETKYEAAGQTMYRGATKYNWEQTVGMNTAMKQFIAAEAATLAVTVDGDPNMPAGFALTVTNDSDAFDLGYDALKLARQTGEGTAEKIKANNKVYKELTSLLDDGQRIFANVPEKKKLFVFQTIKNIVSPPGSAGLTVKVLREGDNTPVEGAAVTIQAAEGTPMNGTTDANGEVNFPDIDPADYNGTVVPPAPLNPKTFVKTVNTGTNARVTVLVN